MLTGKCAHKVSLYTVSQKMCHPIVMIISSYVNRFSQFFHCWKVC